MKVGEAIVKLLEQYDVDTVFGIPGTHSIELYRGLSRSGVTHILPRHEQGAGFMADGYARTTGKPGVCFVISGPGVTNLATPMAEAYHDSVPMLVISPVNRPDPARYNQGRLHEITSQARVTEPFVGFSGQVAEQREIPVLIARAFNLFSSSRPVPVHLNIPIDILGQEVEGEWRAMPYIRPPGGNDASIVAASKLLQSEDRVVIVAGGGARGAADEIQALAEKLDAPVITSVAGRGCVDRNHPLHGGAQLRAAPAQELVFAADLAIVVGSALAQTDHYNDALTERLPQKQVRINLDANALMATGQTIGILGDAKAVLSQLLGRLSGCHKAGGWGLSAARKVRDNLRASLTDKEQKHLRVLESVLAGLPEDAVITSDMTQIAYSGIDLVPLSAGMRWHHPTGYGTLGYGLPAAIGSQIGAAERSVLAIIGDSGLQYTIQEMAVAAELGLPIVVIVWNNDALQQIHDDMVAADIPPNAVNQSNPNFLDLAQIYGWLLDHC